MILALIRKILFFRRIYSNPSVTPAAHIPPLVDRPCIPCRFFHMSQSSDGFFVAPCHKVQHVMVAALAKIRDSIRVSVFKFLLLSHLQINCLGCTYCLLKGQSHALMPNRQGQCSRHTLFCIAASSRKTFYVRSSLRR